MQSRTINLLRKGKEEIMKRKMLERKKKRGLLAAKNEELRKSKKVKDFGRKQNYMAKDQGTELKLCQNERN